MAGRVLSYVALAVLLFGVAEVSLWAMDRPANAPIRADASPIAAPAPAALSAGQPAAPTLAPPVRLLIPALKLDAPVEALGVDRSGALETPQNIWNVGWFRNGPSPGGPGDAVIDGHLGLPGSPLVFSGLPRLKVGADVIAVLADGTKSRFSVTSLRRWPATSPPADLFAGGGQSRLSLITCAGRYDPWSQTYADRLVVQTEYAGPA